MYTGPKTLFHLSTATANPGRTHLNCHPPGRSLNQQVPPTLIVSESVMILTPFRDVWRYSYPSRITTQPPMSNRIILILAPTCITLQIMVLTYHSSCPPSPPLSRTRPAAPTLALLFDFLPPSSLYISRMSTLLGRDTVRASLRHCSSLISLGDW